MKVFRYILSRFRKWYWWFRGWDTLVPQDVWDERLAQCEAPCEHLKDEHCGRCGCPVISKTALASERCPVGYWERARFPRNNVP